MSNYKFQAITADEIDVSVADHECVNPNGDESRNSGPVLWVGTTGNIEVTTTGGTKVVFTNVPVGWFPVQCKIVHTANTTASGLVLVW